LKIIGLGNHLRGDDSIGLRIIEELRRKNLPPSVILIEAGADAFLVLQHLMEKEPVLIIDCALMGKEPGTVVKFNADEFILKKKLDNISLHEFSLAEVYTMAKKMGPAAPCSIIGIQPSSVEFNTPLSDEVKNNIPLILAAVEEETIKCP